MRVFAIGDVCGKNACEKLLNVLPLFKKENSIDFVIANGENSAEGNGITPQSANMLFDAGVDIITGGNHSLKRKEVYNLLDENPYILRPHNFSEAEYGKGYAFVDCGYTSIAILNLSGKIYLDSLKATCPFKAADELIEKAKSDGAKIIIVDFHAEATSEKRALGLYLDGKVSAFFGTHTHVQTADATVLPNKTAYITDLGMTGPAGSVLGVKASIIISRLKDKDTSQRFVLEDGECFINGCIFEIDDKTGKAISVYPVYIGDSQ